MYNRNDEIYIIERRFVQSSQKFEARILKTRIGEEPKQIWAWFEDKWRIGEGGFFMKSENEIVFGSYPEISILKKGGEPTRLFEFKEPIKKIRCVPEDNLLLLGDDKSWLTDLQGNKITQWENLTLDSVQNAPLNRNHIFDADYKNGKLLLANWGNRSFDILDSDGNRISFIQQNEPLIPHWVAFWGENKFLFSSKFVFNGSNPEPHLLLYTANKEKITIWSKGTGE
jgi:hypothetical protein